MTPLLAFMLLAALLQALAMLRGLSLARLDVGPLPGRDAWPALSVVVPARNEARHIESALGSLLAADYPGLEVIVVDDRSTDATGEILGRLARSHPRLRVLRVESLPEGWLGKNHALALGAAKARGEWLLFTDADVHLAPDLLRRAVAHASANAVDHLALLVRIHSRSVVVRAFIAFFGCAFLSHLKPWRAREPGARHYVGIGAFNLVRRQAYEAVGGHAPIRLRPDDDIKLGKLLKLGGCRAECATAVSLGEVEWYADWGETVRGLEKNLFAGVDYRLLPALGAVLAPLAFMTLPLLGVFSGDVLTCGLALGVYAVNALQVGAVAHAAGLGAWLGLLHPLSAAAFSGVMARTVAKNLLEGGLRWRGTFYPLDALRRNRV